MFNGAGAMWSSVELPKEAQPRECGHHAAKAGGDLRDHGEGTAMTCTPPAAQRQGSETPSCSRPANNAPRGRRMLRFSSIYR